MDISEILKKFNSENLDIKSTKMPNMLKNQYTNAYNLTASDIKLIKTMDTLNIPQNIKDLVMQILTQEENYKKNILRALYIPPDINPIDVLQTIIDMKREVTDINGISSTKLIFKENTDTDIMDIITDAIYAYSGVNRRNVLKFAVVNSDGEPLQKDAECSLENLSKTCKYILSENKDSYIIIKGDLDAKTLIKNKFDFSYLSRIVVTGNYTCSKDNKIFPYQVDGTFDCHGLGKNDGKKNTDYITQNLVFPITQKINCAYSFTDFDVLMNILPQDLETLIVHQDLITKKSLSKQKHLTNVLNFITKYPNVTILDSDGKNLLDVLIKCIQNTDTQNSENITKNPTVIENIFEQKIIGKHMDIKDILKYCRTKQEFNIFSDDVLERLIRGVLSDLRKNGIEKKKLHRDDGVIVNCIDASQKELLCQDILKIATERENKEEIEQQIIKQTPITVKRKPIKIKKRVKIKKYITPSVLKQITNSSKQNVENVLLAINEINLNPLDMQFQGPVHIIKNGKTTLSAMVKKENGCCLVQSIDSSVHTDPKRIVWAVADGPNGLIIISVGFCEHHNTKKASDNYVSLRAQALKKQKYTKEQLTGYMDIDEIIKGYNQNIGNQGDNFDLNNNILTTKMAAISQKTY